MTLSILGASGTESDQIEILARSILTGSNIFNIINFTF